MCDTARFVDECMNSGTKTRKTGWTKWVKECSGCGAIVDFYYTPAPTSTLANKTVVQSVFPFVCTKCNGNGGD